MQEFRLSFSMDNDAFENPIEVARCLRRVLDQIVPLANSRTDLRGEAGKVLDTNGNTVGDWSVRGRR